MTTQNITPIQPSERFHYLDVLRGFALIGVLLANMYSHSGYFFLSDESMKQVTGDTGYSLLWGLHFITDGKFYSLFSLLFGIGFALQLERSFSRHQPFAGRFSRRLFTLFLFGLAHGVLFYVGDILMLYAILGFFLLLFRKASDKALLIWSIIILALPVFQYLFMWWDAQPIADPNPVRNPMMDQLISVYSGGSFAEIIQMNIGGLIFGRYPDIIFTGRVFRVLGMFVLGYYVARKKLYLPTEENLALAWKVLIWGLLIGIPCNIILSTMMETNLYYGFGAYGYLQPIVYAYGVPALGLAYAAGIFLLLQKSSAKKILMILSPFGRMALTNYLSQSVIACLIYCSYGLGLFGTDGPVQFTMVGIGILIFQIAFSHVWLSRFQYGPLEWLWRSITYRKWQSLKTPSSNIQKQAVL